jgi:hypothetical protein
MLEITDIAWRALVATFIAALAVWATILLFALL